MVARPLVHAWPPRRVEDNPEHAPDQAMRPQPSRRGHGRAHQRFGRHHGIVSSFGIEAEPELQVRQGQVDKSWPAPSALGFCEATADRRVPGADGMRSR